MEVEKRILWVWEGVGGAHVKGKEGVDEGQYDVLVF